MKKENYFLIYSSNGNVSVEELGRDQLTARIEQDPQYWEKLFCVIKGEKITPECKSISFK